MKYSITLVAFALASLVSSVAIPEGLPAAFAIAAASYQCHAHCGNAIATSRNCSVDSGYDIDCLCAADSAFIGLINNCLDCAWCLWDDYGKLLEAPLAACDLPIIPTGTACAPSATAETSVELAITETSTEGTIAETSVETITAVTSAESIGATGSTIINPTVAVESSTKSIITTDFSTESAAEANTAPTSVAESTNAESNRVTTVKTSSTANTTSKFISSVTTGRSVAESTTGKFTTVFTLVGGSTGAKPTTDKSFIAPHSSDKVTSTVSQIAYTGAASKNQVGSAILAGFAALLI